MPNISVFGSIYETKSEGNVDLDVYLYEVKSGRWEDHVNPIRLEKNEKKQDKLKMRLQRVTFSGIFETREDSGLIEHSGFIAIDLDDIADTENVKTILSQDKYVYACFVSSGGHGLTVLFRIQAKKHREAYLGISDYLWRQYALIPDPGSISPVKPFGVTFDPHIYVAEKSTPVFVLYPKEREVKRLENFAFAKDDFEELIKTILARGINLCEEYNEWLKIGFAFADRFGESGRQYFHAVSSVSPKYNTKRTDDQYKYCLKNTKQLKVATISTFYWYCKEAGLQVTSERTVKVRKTTLTAKVAGLSKEKIVEKLEKEGIIDVEELVSDIFDGAANVGDVDSTIEQLELFVSSNYNFQRNTITRYLERDGKEMTQSDLNSIYIAAKKLIPIINYDLVDRLLLSDFVESYNPIINFFNSLDAKENGLITKLASTIKNNQPEYTEYFLRKWLVGIVSSAFGEHSPLMFVLLGENQGRGKTEWFRRLMPKPLKRYYAESKLDAGKDDEILMTQKLIIMDDELSGKSKREIQRLKELTSKETFSLREPYGRTNVDLQRIAVLCGTSNFKEILHDPTGNRRIIPISVDDIDQSIYNSIPKDELFAEMFYLWKTGFEWRVISREDIDFLRLYEVEYEALNFERELIQRFYRKSNTEHYSSTEIMVELGKVTNQRISLDQLGKQLSKLGFLKKSVRLEDGTVSKHWFAERTNPNNNNTFKPATNEPI